jgi:hypothetical protein
MTYSKKKKFTVTGFFAYLFNHLKANPWRYLIGFGLALSVAAVLAIPGIGQAAGLAGAIGYLFVSTGVQLGLFATAIALCVFLATVLISLAIDKIDHAWRNQVDVGDLLTQEPTITQKPEPAIHIKLTPSITRDMHAQGESTDKLHEDSADMFTMGETLIGNSSLPSTSYPSITTANPFH